MKCKRNKAITGSGTWAAPTKERYRHNGGLIREVIPGSVYPGHFINRYRAVWESPLDVYRTQGVLSRKEYRAGLRFHRAYYGVVLLRRRDFRPVSVTHAAWPETPVEQLLKRARMLIKPEDLNAVIEICGHSQPARNLVAVKRLKRGLRQLVGGWQAASREVNGATQALSFVP